MSELEARRKKVDPIFAPWFQLSELTAADFSAKAKPLLAKFAGDPAVNPVVIKALSAATNSSKEVAEVYEKLFKEANADWKAALTAATNGTSAGKTQTNGPPARLSDPDAKHCARSFTQTARRSICPKLKLKPFWPESSAKAPRQSATELRP